MSKSIKSFITLFMAVMILVGCSNTDNNQTAGGEQSTDSETPTTTTGSNFNETDFPIVNEPITLTLMGSSSAIQSPWEELEFFKYMNDLTNIDFEFNTVDSTSYEERKNLAFATNSLPDVFFAAGLTPMDEVKYGAEGTLIPLNELIEEYAPNIKKLMEEDPNLRPSITTVEGNIYALPAINTLQRDLTNKFFINTTWVEELGLEVPKTLDELYTVLKAFKEEIPNSIPASGIYGSSNTDLRLLILTALGYVDTEFGIVDDKVVYVPAQEEYKEYLSYMNKLWEEELLDPEYFVQTDAQYKAKGVDMRVGLFHNAAAYTYAKVEDEPNFRVQSPLTSEWNSEPTWPKYTGVTRGTFAITSENPEPEATMRWVDQIYSDEGADMIILGPEDLGWKWTDDTKQNWTQNNEVIAEAGFDGWTAYKAAKLSPHAGSTVPSRINEDMYNLEDLSGAPQSARRSEQVAEYLVPHWRDAFPLLYYTEDETSRLTSLSNDITTYIEQIEAKFITGDEPISNWENYLETLERMGLAELLEIQQIAYDRWKSAS